MPIMVPMRTLAIQSKGVGRLSPDLAATSDEFVWEVDRKKKKLWLSYDMHHNGAETLKVWRAGNQTRSAMIALLSVLKILGLDPEKLKGKVFDVKVHEKKLEIQF